VKSSTHRSLIVGALIFGTVACGDDDTDTDPGPPGPGDIVPAPGGIRRQTTSQLRYSFEYLLGTDSAVLIDLWTDPQLRGFESIAAAELSFGANDVSSMELTFNLAIDTALANPATLEGFAPCVVSSPNAACYETVVDDFVSVAWRRPVESDERARLLAIASEGQAWGSGDFDAGLKYMLSAVFQSPNFLYLVELGEGSDAIRRPLNGYEVATRLSFFINHQTPDVALLEAARTGSLDTEAGVRKEAERLLKKPEARRSLDRFFSELYLIRDISDITKDPAVEPGWNDALAAAMQEELLRFLQDIVWTRDADAREILTSADTFVNPLLAEFYGVPAPANGWQKVTLEGQGDRVGILGKAGLLARFGHPDSTSPTKRGRFFRERLLCRTINAAPPGVDTTLPAGDFKTMRERLEVHNEVASCASCHRLMDPLGLTMENFDLVGRYRETDNGNEIITKDESGDLKFDDFADLSEQAAERSGPCFVSNFFRQATGHEERDGELEAVDALVASFEDKGFHIQELMVEMALSPAFLNVGLPK
jgi:hypothetical protein